MKKLLSILMLVTFLCGCEKNSPPTCLIVSPENAAEIICGELVTFSIDAHDPDGSIQEVKLYIDDIEIASVEELPYDFSWETGDAELGRHNIRAVAIDDGKGEGEAGIFIEIFGVPDDVENPVVELLSLIEDSTVNGIINIVAKALDNIGVEFVEFMIQDEDWVVFEKDSTSTFFEYSASFNTNNYPDGLTILSIAAYDAAGNCGDHSFNVFINNSGDTIAPIVEIFAPVNNDTVSGHIVLRAKVTDNVGIDYVNFNVLDGNWELLGTDFYAIRDNEYSFLWDTKNTPDGTYGIEAVAYDAVANNGYDQIGITIDNSGSIAGDDSFIYDRRKYHFKTIGTQTWMTENLAYLPTMTYSGDGSGSPPFYYVYDYHGDNISVAKHTDNYRDYGVLYNWEAAITACPPGWHLPSDEEWQTLEKYLGMSSSDAGSLGWRNFGDVGRKLKSTSRWNSNGNGNNSSGFQALPGGCLSHDGFNYLGFMADFWSSSIVEQENALSRRLNYDSDGVFRSSYKRGYGLSVRCIKD